MGSSVWQQSPQCVTLLEVCHLNLYCTCTSAYECQAWGDVEIVDRRKKGERRRHTHAAYDAHHLWCYNVDACTPTVELVPLVNIQKIAWSRNMVRTIHGNASCATQMVVTQMEHI